MLFVSIQTVVDLVALLLIYKEYYGRTNVMIQSNTMYGVKTITKTAGYNLVDIIRLSTWKL